MYIFGGFVEMIQMLTLLYTAQHIKYLTTIFLETESNNLDICVHAVL